MNDKPTIKPAGDFFTIQGTRYVASATDVDSTVNDYMNYIGAKGELQPDGSVQYKIDSSSKKLVALINAQFKPISL